MADRMVRERDTMRGERKAVTVLFADIKGSSAFVQYADPEDANAVLQSMLNGMIEAVHRFGGIVSKVMGDGLMALFGAPRALEDHATRAACAALAMREQARRTAAELREERGVELKIRIGLNAGEVVVLGTGSGDSIDYDAVGATVHLAARMEQSAAPDTIRLTATVAASLSGRMHLRPLGPQTVHGFAEPVHAYELVEEVVSQTLAEPVSLAPLVGRAGALELLAEAARLVGAGRGQIVTVIGEAGMGKSRLAIELSQRLRSEGWLHLATRAAPHETEEPWLAIRGMLRAFFGSAVDAEAIERIRDHLAAGGPMLAAAEPALLELMGFDVRDAAWRALKPPERRQRLIDACRAWILFESRKRPVLIAADDLQWTDGETRSLLWSVASLLHGARILLLVMTRPGGEQSVPGAAAHIRLQPLDASESEQYLRRLMGDAAPSDAVLSEVVTRAGGNPLFLGEIARAFRDAGEWRADDVPPTVQAIIAARIDMLPADAKSLLQAASVLGHEFELDHLVETAAAEPAQIRTTLGQLQAAGFIQELCVLPDASFGFDQPLVREVVYRGLVKDKRRALHQSAFHGLQAIKGHNCALHVGALAHHALAAGLWEQAARFCRLAGHRAARQSAYKEAASLYGSATEAAARLPDTPEGQRELIDIRLDRRHALFPLGRFAEIGRELELARSAAEMLGDIARLGSVLLLETTHGLGAGRHRDAIATGSRALKIVDELGDRASQREVMFHLVQANASIGEYDAAIGYGERLVSLAGDGPTGVTTSSLARMWLAWCCAELGRFEQGHLHAAAAQAAVSAQNQPLPILLAHLARGLVLLREQRFDEVTSTLEPALKASEVVGLQGWWGALGSPLGRAWLGLDRTGDAVALLEKVVAHSASSRGSGHVLRSVHLAEAYLAAGRLDDAERLADDCLRMARLHDEHGHEAYALLLAAEVARARGDHSADEKAQEAAALAGHLEMLPLRQRIKAFLSSIDSGR